MSKVVSCCHHQLRRFARFAGSSRSCHSIAGFSIHFIATGLLQLIVVASAKVSHSGPAACDECSGSSHHELVVVRPCEASSEAATLAPGSAKNYIQAVPEITYKLCLFMHHIHTGQAPQYLSRLCIHSFCTQCMQIAAEVDWLSGLRSAKNNN